MDTDSSLTDVTGQRGGKRVTTPGSVERHDSTTSSGSGMETPDSQVRSLVYKYFNLQMNALHTKKSSFGMAPRLFLCDGILLIR